MNSRISPRKRVLLIAVAALPLAASFGFQALERTPQTPATAGNRPALAFDQYLVNLGELHNAPRADAQFSFKNCGKSPARIISLEPSCGCLNTKIEKRAYQPGEICEFALNVLTTHQPPGPHEYSLTINYEDPQPRKATVALKLIVRREVTLNPPQLLFYQNGRDPGQRDVTVTDMRPKPFRVTGASCKSPLVIVTVKEPIDDPEGGRETPVSIAVAANCPEEGEKTFVYLYTDDPGYPRIQIPVWIREMKLSGIQQTSGRKNSVDLPQAGALMPREQGWEFDRDRIALGIQQPWAELILRGVKTLEVRSQPTRLRGTIYIYASKRPSQLPAAAKMVKRERIDLEALPLGVLVGTVDLIGCRECRRGDHQAACVPAELLAGQFAWELAAPRRLSVPLGARFLPYGIWFYPFKRRSPAH